MLISVFILTMVVHAAHSFKAVLVNGSMTISDFDKACESSGFIPGEKKNDKKNSTEEFVSFTAMLETLCPYVSYHPVNLIASPDIVSITTTNTIPKVIFPPTSVKDNTTTNATPLASKLNGTVKIDDTTIKNTTTTPILTIDSDKVQITTETTPLAFKLNGTTVKIADTTKKNNTTTPILTTESDKDNITTEATPAAFKMNRTTVKIDDTTTENNTTTPILTIESDKDNLTTEAMPAASKLNKTTVKIDKTTTKNNTTTPILTLESDKDNITTETTPSASKLNGTTVKAVLVMDSHIDVSTTEALPSASELKETTIQSDEPSTKHNATTAVLVTISDKDNITTKATPSVSKLNETTVKIDDITTENNTETAGIVTESDKDDITTEATPSPSKLNGTTVKIDDITSKSNTTIPILSTKSDKDKITTETTPSVSILNKTTVEIESDKDNTPEVDSSVLISKGLLIENSTKTTPMFEATNKFITVKYISFEEAFNEYSMMNSTEYNSNVHTNDELIIPSHDTANEKGRHYDDNKQSEEMDQSEKDDDHDGYALEDMSLSNITYTEDEEDDNSSEDNTTREATSSKYTIERTSDLDDENEIETQESDIEEDNANDHQNITQGTRIYKHDTKSVDARRKIVVITFVTVILILTLIWAVRFLYKYFTGKGKYVVPQEEEDNNDMELGEHLE